MMVSAEVLSRTFVLSLLVTGFEKLCAWEETGDKLATEVTEYSEN